MEKTWTAPSRSLPRVTISVSGTHMLAATFGFADGYCSGAPLDYSDLMMEVSRRGGFAIAHGLRGNSEASRRVKITITHNLERISETLLANSGCLIALVCLIRYCQLSWISVCVRPAIGTETIQSSSESTPSNRRTR